MRASPGHSIWTISFQNTNKTRGISASNLQRLLVLQKRATRALSGLGFRESCREAFIRLVLTVVNLYVKEVLMYVVEQSLMTTTPDVAEDGIPSKHLTQYEKNLSYGVIVGNILDAWGILRLELFYTKVARCN
ncbi:hypothetical protein J6590_034619 [Homalodisca vitripennis]|nr:hypothetical protein J6590_034619 [Homalodisca vitripennis]